MQRWLALAGLLLVLYLARSVLPPFVLAGILAYGLTPVVTSLSERLRVRRGIAAALLYALLLGAIAAVLFAIEPPLVRETRGLVANAPELTRTLFRQIFGGDRFEFFGVEYGADETLARLQEALADYLGRPSDAFHIAVSLVEGIGHLFLFLIASFYMVVDGARIGDFCLRLVPPEHRARVAEVADRIHLQLGRYLRGQAALVVLMSAVSWVVLHFVFHLRFALPVAIMTGCLEIIPIVGPAVAAAIAASIGLTTQGVGHAVGLIVAYTVLRQVEDQLVMPLVVGRAVHLHPLVTLFAVLAGGAIAGLLGMLLAIPIAAAVKVILDEYLAEVEGAPGPVEAPAPQLAPATGTGIAPPRGAP